MKTVAIQGIKGAYHDSAARKYFRDEEEISILPCKHSRDIIFEILEEYYETNSSC
jgi:prephenate dehydratase